MVAERLEFLVNAEGNKSNGLRQGHSFGQGRVLELRILRDRYSTFHPKIFTLLRDQEMEFERLAGSLCCGGMTKGHVIRELIPYCFLGCQSNYGPTLRISRHIRLLCLP